VRGALFGQRRPAAVRRPAALLASSPRQLPALPPPPAPPNSTPNTPCTAPKPHPQARGKPIVYLYGSRPFTGGLCAGAGAAGWTAPLAPGQRGSLFPPPAGPACLAAC
jgi:hypothetical protein